jgi:hypothetical protein
VFKFSPGEGNGVEGSFCERINDQRAYGNGYGFPAWSTAGHGYEFVYGNGYGFQVHEKGCGCGYGDGFGVIQGNGYGHGNHVYPMRLLSRDV